jgi:hypothetical protein
MQNEQQEAQPPPAVNEQTAAQQLAAFQALLLQIRLTQAQVDAICEATGCVNIVMVGLLSADQISRTCKRIGTRAENPILINTVQEQLLLALRFWVVSKQRLHLPLNTQEFTMYTALNQAQLMRQQLEDDARLDKETVAVIIEEEMVEVQTETATKPEDISIQDTMIKMSGIIYPWNRRTKCWKPEAQNEMWDQ